MSRADGMPQLRTTKRPQAASPASAAPTRPPYQKYELVVAPSQIDGQGVFAAEPIAAGRKIGEIRGEAISVDEARIRATRSEHRAICTRFCRLIAKSLPADGDKIPMADR